MTLKDLINEQNWLLIEPRFRELYPDENLMGYELVFDKLTQTAAASSEMKILVEIVTPETDPLCDEPYVHIYGINANSPKNEENYTYALEFTPWEEWLGMEIHPSSLENFSHLDIVIYCLWEMTFIGFDEDTIKEQRDELNRRIKNIEDGKEITYTLDEVKEHLKKRLGL